MRKGDGRAAVVVMAKAPIAGIAKTRLAGRLSADERARLQEAFIADALATARAAAVGPVYLSFWPAGAAEYFHETFGDRLRLMAQDGADLGERMLNAITHAVSRGHAPVIVVGTDSPTLPPHHIQAARSALDRAQACLGPASDGGYYLIGIGEPHAVAFRDIPWGTADVLSVTVRRLQDAGIGFELLDPWYDVDTPEDLDRLIEELRELERRPRARVPRRTRDLLLPAIGAAG